MSEYIYDWTPNKQNPKERIVRCRDCAHYSEYEWITASNGLWTDIGDVCDFWHGEPTKVATNGFCAWGERKGDA